MEITAEKHPQRGLEATLTSDDGEVIHWPMPPIMSRNISRHDPSLAFRELNVYWASVSATRRKNIFQVYKRINDHIDDIFDVQQLQKALQQDTVDLLELHPRHELVACLNKCNITYPRSVKESGQVQFQASKTYDVEKYERLLVLAMAIRTLSPVWSVYVSIMDRYAGKNYKELMALRLVARSWIVTDPGFEELQAYINANLKEDESSLSSLISGIGSEMIGEWLLALVCVRRLATKELSGDGENNNLVSNIHSIVTSSLKSKDKTFSGYFRDKRPKADGGDDNQSLLEEYKIKEEVPEGEKAGFSAYPDDLVKVARQIDETVDPDLVKRCWAHNENQLHYTTTPGQTRILQWVCGPAMPLKSIRIINKPTKLRLLSVAQSILMHWGYPQLAAYMVACRVDDGMQKVQVTENRARFPKELAAQIEALYPHIPQHMKLTRHPVAESIVNTVEDLAAHDWYVEGPGELHQAIADYVVDGQYVTPGDIQRLVAELVVRVAQRNH